MDGTAAFPWRQICLRPKRRVPFWKYQQVSEWLIPAKYAGSSDSRTDIFCERIYIFRTRLAVLAIKCFQARKPSLNPVLLNVGAALKEIDTLLPLCLLSYGISGIFTGCGSIGKTQTADCCSVLGSNWHEIPQFRLRRNLIFQCRTRGHEKLRSPCIENQKPPGVLLSLEQVRI